MNSFIIIIIFIILFNNSLYISINLLEQSIVENFFKSIFCFSFLKLYISLIHKSLSNFKNLAAPISTSFVILSDKKQFIPLTWASIATIGKPSLIDGIKIKSKADIILGTSFLLPVNITLFPCLKAYSLISLALLPSPTNKNLQLSILIVSIISIKNFRFFSLDILPIKPYSNSFSLIPY